jgi:hypothetical protein
MADYETSPSTAKLDWQQKFEAALLEADPQQLPQLVEMAEAAVFLRLQSLANSPDGHVEQNALNDAMRTLRVIQTKSPRVKPPPRLIED